MVATIPAIQTEALSKQFGSLEVLREINCSVWPGEVVCILGPSGSGKSTLLRCLNWLSPPTSGWVKIRGEILGLTLRGEERIPVSAAVLRQQRSRIGMVFQNFNLWPHRTALGNVMEGLRVVKKLSPVVAKERAFDYLHQVGLADKAEEYPAKLSGGQQQRVAIARALAMEPEILLFDEPTSSLDPELVGEVLSVMKELASRHITMMVVTHEIGFAAEAADRILFMDQGRIVEEGLPRQLLRNPQQPRTQQFLDQFMSRYGFLTRIFS